MSKVSGTLLTLAGVGAVIASAACATRGTTSVPATATAGRGNAADSVQIGYGTQSRDKATGANTTLTTADMTRRTVRVEELLRGRAAGVEVLQDGSNVRLRIRGSASMTQEVEPLVLVDGMVVPTGQISNALAGLVPEDIDQVNVLKDVASTSVYGTRGAGGVILIKTKKGRPR